MGLITYVFVSEQMREILTMKLDDHKVDATLSIRCIIEFSIVFEPRNIEFKIRLKIDESSEQFVRTDHS